jgi:hypothetical protein
MIVASAAESTALDLDEVGLLALIRLVRCHKPYTSARRRMDFTWTSRVSSSI